MSQYLVSEASRTTRSHHPAEEALSAGAHIAAENVQQNQSFGKKGATLLFLTHNNNNSFNVIMPQRRQ